MPFFTNIFLDDTLDLREKGPKDVDVAQVLTRLGALYSELNRYSEAEEAFEKALQIRIEKLGPTHTRVGQTLKHMLAMYEEQGISLLLFMILILYVLSVSKSSVRQSRKGIEDWKQSSRNYRGPFRTRRSQC